MKLRLAALALLATSSVALAADKSIVDIAVGSADHSTLVAAVQAAGLVETLSGAGPFTLLKPENKDQLTKILTCHVVGAQALAADVAKMITDGSGTATIETLGGCKLEATLDGDMVKIKSGPFDGFDGTIDEVQPDKGTVTVTVTIFGRPTPVSLKYWEVEPV